MAATSHRKRAVQQELFRHGGKRRGAGRKPEGMRARESHAARVEFKASQPLHVAMRERFRIVHISLQRDHVHMIVEAENKEALAKGMQGFMISAAKHLNRALGDGERRRRGKVFNERYHVEVITSPTQARHTLGYVLGNWRKHKEDQQGLASTWLVDPFSTGVLFAGWQELDGQPWMWPIREGYDPMIVFRPRSWLLREGWKLWS